VSEAKVTAELVWYGDEIIKRLIESQRHTISQGVDRMRDSAKRHCPFGQTRQKGAHLVESIEARMKKGFPEGYVFAGIYKPGAPAYSPHAHLVEMGTVKMRAQPFMRPAFDENVNTVKDTHLRETRKIVK